MCVSPTIYTGRDGKQVRVWVCDVCSLPFEWGMSSGVYGPIDDEEAGRWDRLFVVCSLACRSKAGRDPLPEGGG